jgi:transcriptional regulator with XRE-family HTH domain
LSVSDYHGEHRKLADRLKEFRRRSRLTGTEVAQRLGWAQSKVSRIERAQQFPSEEDIRGWLQTTGAPAEAIGELLALLEHARAEYRQFREHFRIVGGVTRLQSSLLALETQANRILAFQPALIPGLLQTAEYTRELLHLPSGPLFLGGTEDDIAQIVAVRMQRQQVLYQPGKSIQVVLLEGALRCRLCMPATLLGQLDRLLALHGLPTLKLGIIPSTAQVPVYPLSGLDIYDSNILIAETVTGEMRLSDPQEVAKYVQLFGLLREAASFGDAAAEIIQQVAGELREELGSGGERS